MAFARVEVKDLLTGELDVSICSQEVRIYRCGHVGAEKFVVIYKNAQSETYDQREFCPECARELACEEMVRCYICGEIFEESALLREDRNDPESHFRKCLCQKIKGAYLEVPS